MKVFIHLILICIPLFSYSSQSVDNRLESKDVVNKKPETLIQELYNLVSTDKGQVVDWEKVRSMFLEEAIVILRTSRDSTHQLTLDGYIQDFKEFYTYKAVNENGFQEKITEMKSSVYRDMAIVEVNYEASIPGFSKSAQKGMDYFLLTKKSNEWKIVAITNEIIIPN